MYLKNQERGVVIIKEKTTKNNIKGPFKKYVTRLKGEGGLTIKMTK